MMVICLNSSNSLLYSQQIERKETEGGNIQGWAPKKSNVENRTCPSVNVLTILAIYSSLIMPDLLSREPSLTLLPWSILVEGDQQQELI